MIQRIQTLYLLLVFICLGCMFLTPLATFQDMVWDVKGLHNVTEGEEIDSLLSFPLAGVVIGLMALTLFIIFSFKTRKRQIALGRLNYFLILLLVVLIYLSIDKYADQFGGTENISYGIGTYLPIIALGLHLMANKAIKRDENLVKSVERLR